MGLYREIRITYRTSAHGGNAVFTFPYPKSWGRLSGAERVVWAKDVLKHFNAQWIFVRVDDGVTVSE